MNELSNSFLRELTEISKNLMQEKKDCEYYWLPDTPPITTLFSVLGCRISEDFCLMEKELKTKIFKKIEEGMSSGRSTSASGFQFLPPYTVERGNMLMSSKATYTRKQRN